MGVVASIAVTGFVGFALERLDRDPEMGPQEALLLVAIAWLAVFTGAFWKR